MPTLKRLKNRKDFLAIAARNRRWVTPSFIVQADPPRGDNDAGSNGDVWAGFTVSKKVGNAVARNRLRRRLRELARLNLMAVSKPGWRYVFVGRATACEASFERLQKDLGWAIAKLTAGADLKRGRKD